MIAQAIFLFPYYAGAVVGGKLAAVFGAVGVAAALAWGPRARRPERVVRGALLGVSSYLFLGLLILWPFDRALADCRDWYARGGDLVVGMSRADIEATLAARGVVRVRDDGPWLTFTVEPSGRAGLHPFLGVSGADLFVFNVRFDPESKLAVEVSTIAE